MVATRGSDPGGDPVADRAAAGASGDGGRHRRPRRVRVRALAVALLVLALVAPPGTGSLPADVVPTADGALPPPEEGALGATGRLPGTPLPPLPAPPLAGSEGLPDGAVTGIPDVVLAAYRGAADRMASFAPGCHLDWSLLAGIGKVESSHARGGAVEGDGTTTTPILGPRLVGTDGNAAIRDTDAGALDGDPVWDRAVGPTQFLPQTWSSFGADGNGDGRRDPDNVHDAALATGRYLCAGGLDVGAPGDRHDAVFRYNHSEDYVATVLRWAHAYADGVVPLPSGGDGAGAGSDPALLADAGAPAGVPDLAAMPSPLAPAPAAAPTPAALRAAPAGLPAAPAPPATPTASFPAAPAVRPEPPRPEPPTTRPVAPKPPAAQPGTPKPPAPSSPKAPTSTPSTTTPSTTTPSTPVPSAPAAAACAGLSADAVATALGVPASGVTAANSADARERRCTISGPQGPLLRATASSWPTAATAKAAAAGLGGPGTVRRTGQGTETVVVRGTTVWRLLVPTAAGVPATAAETALPALGKRVG